MIDRFLYWGNHVEAKSGKIKGSCQPPLFWANRVHRSHMIFRRGRLGTRLSKFVRKDGSAARQRRDGSACIHRLTESVRFVFFDRYVHFIRDH